MSRYKQLILPLLSGVLLSLPWIIPGCGMVLFIAFVPLFLADQLQRNDADFYLPPFGQAYLAFLIWNLCSTWWIAYVSFPGMAFITGANALLMAIVWWGSRKLGKTSVFDSGNITRIIFWIAFEYLNHRGMLPWPWLTLGNGFANSVKFIQWYEYTGVLGGSLWILLVNILIFRAVRRMFVCFNRPIFNWLYLALAVIAIPVILSFHLYSGAVAVGAKQQVVVVQPNIDPYTEKFSGMSVKEQMDKLLNLASSELSDSTNLVLAPETAIPEVWEDSCKLSCKVKNEIQQLLRPFPKASFAGGVISHVGVDAAKSAFSGIPGATGDNGCQSYNSVFLTANSGEFQFCHKNRLVAGVEYQPIHKYLKFLPDLLIDLGGETRELTAGEKPAVFTTRQGWVIGPVICFESVFGDYVRQLPLHGAEYLVVLTNDGWWKHSSGVWQHFGYSRLRSIETRRYAVRSANTGISGFIDVRGEVQEQTEIAQSGVLTGRIVCNNGLTFYVRYGDYLGQGALWLVALIIVYTLLGAGTKKNPH